MSTVTRCSPTASSVAILSRLAVPRGLAGLVLFTAAGTILFVIYYILLKGGHPTLWPGSYEYAQVARIIAEGRGLNTNAVTVLEFWFLNKAGWPMPYFFHDIGNSLLLALFFRIFGTSERVVGLMSGTFFVLCVPLTYLLGSKLFDRRAALVAATLVLINTELIVFSVTGHSEVPYSFFLTLLLYLLYTQRSSWGLVLTGLVFGFLIVLRSNSLPFLPWIILFLVVNPGEALGDGHPRARSFLSSLYQTRKLIATRLSLFLVGFAVLFVPNAIRNYMWMGNPLYNVNSIYSLVWYTSAIEGKSQAVFSMPGLNVDPLRFIATHPGELFNKMHYQLSRTIEQLWAGGVLYPDNRADGFLIFLFLVALLAPSAREDLRARYFRLLVVAMIITALLVGAAFNIRWRHMYGFIPVVLIYVGEFLTRVIGEAWRGSLRRACAGGLAIGLLLIVLALAGINPILANINPADANALNHRYRKVATFVQQNTPPSAVILTSAKSGPLIELQNALAWYTGRQFVEYGNYTAEALKSRNPSPPTFLLIAAGDPNLKKSLSNPQPRPGWIPIANQKDETGKVIAILLQQE